MVLALMVWQPSLLGTVRGPTAVRVHLGRLRAGRSTRDLYSPRLRHARQTVLPWSLAIVSRGL